MQKEQEGVVAPELQRSEILEENYELNEEQKKELENLYEDVFNQFQIGKILSGKIVSKDNSGLWVDILYKSNGFIPHYEFSEYEFKKLEPDQNIEVLLDRLEDEYGNVVLSYQKDNVLFLYYLGIFLSNTIYYLSYIFVLLYLLFSLPL